MATLKTVKSDSKRRLINLKANREERNAIKANAKKFARGNVSEWVRYAAINFKPRSEDLK